MTQRSQPRMGYIFCLYLCFCLWGSASSWAEISTYSRRLALLIGRNDAGDRVAALRYAQADARKMRDVLLQVAGYRPSHIRLLLQPSLEQVRLAMRSLEKQIARLRKQSNTPIFLIVYYSGHAKQGKLLLGSDDMSFQELQQFLRNAGADLRLAILDACETGGLTLLKGLRRKARHHAPHIQLTPVTQGEVVITAAGERDSAHEDPTLRGGIFTHFLVSGLRGAADRDRNGRITLDELYQYAYARTLERTILSSHGPQRAHYRQQISGVGQIVLASLQRPQAWLLLHQKLAGAFYVWNTRRDTLLAEVTKRQGKSATIALAPGQYALQWRRRGGLYSTEFELQRGQRMRLRRLGPRVAYAYEFQNRTATRGNQELERWTFFDGQMEGVSIDVQYRLGWSGLDSGILHHGPHVGFLIPIESAMEGRFALLFRFGYQYGQATVQPSLAFDLHLFSLDIGGVWTVFQRRKVWMGLGGRLRASPLFQNILPRNGRDGESVLSFAWGAGLLWSTQIHLGERWFLQFELDGGMRILPIADTWNIRWDLGIGAGIGRRF